MVITAITSNAVKVAQVYNKQRFYAERAAQIKMPKTVQIGVEDKITISPDAATRMAASNAAPSVLQKAKAIYYEDPRIKARRAQMSDRAEKSEGVEGFQSYADLVKTGQTKSSA
ncbi:hypothetical protein MNBD_NITROSPINAE04-2387 [hydrothermal vent metagenome]|uniref:Uncharacterized protein n=1 Tax=hydrothermal vent metagenome TaxID=652676 RepID=A0A3B1C6K8_9ZZZZ